MERLSPPPPAEVAVSSIDGMGDETPAGDYIELILLFEGGEWQNGKISKGAAAQLRDELAGLLEGWTSSD